ncbi:MAG: GNAT family N-acetyltransferase [Ferruginibacter sp.]
MLVLNFDPFPILETERMILRAVSLEDAEDMFFLRTNEDAMKFINKALPKSIADILELVAKMNDNTMRIQWAMALKTDNKLIGTIGYHIIDKDHHRAELGYMLHPMQWNKGLMSEAIQAVLDFGFNKLGLHSIEARINPANNASSKILLKHNFVKEGYFKESYLFEGTYFDSEIYGLVK